ncbi:MAG: CinA family protein [Caldilineae bacterium]|nr:CinA family protein [Chloroflexota bacterium]MCB9176457.1 CinA family protein [Caldilineae bacterium]
MSGPEPDSDPIRAEPTIGCSELEQRASTLALELGPALRAAGLRLATAESCTGGWLGALLTAAPGSSDYYLGGVVAYANATKVALLGVAPELLAYQGAVSEAVARAMAAGLRARLEADLAVSITGVAGPGGGTPGKPVGTVWIGLAGPEGSRAARHRFRGDRQAVRLAAAAAALEMLSVAVRERGAARAVAPD